MSKHFFKHAFVSLCMAGFLLAILSVLTLHSMALEPSKQYQVQPAAFITQTTATVAGWDTTRPWELFGFEKIGVESIEYSPDFANDKTIFLTAYDDVKGYVYRSTDAGRTWVMLPGHTFAALDIAVSPNYANDHTIFLHWQFHPILPMTGRSLSVPTGDIFSAQPMAAIRGRIWGSC